MADSPGLFDRIVSNFEERVQDFTEKSSAYTKKLQADEVTFQDHLDQGLMGAANAVGMVGDVPAELFTTLASAVTPDVAKDYLKGAAGQVMASDTAQSAMQYMSENPEVADRIGYGAELAALIPGMKAAQSGLRSVSLEAPNKQEGFYGSGGLGAAASIAKTAPRAVVDAVDPRAVASRREGLPMAVRRVAAPITDQRISEYNKIKAKPASKRDATDADFIKSFNSDLSYVEGQLDQTQLINYGRGKDSEGLIKDFEKVQAVSLGNLDSNLVKTAVDNSTQLKKSGIKLNANEINTVTQRIQDAQGINSNALAVVRNPTAFSDTARESLKGPSMEATMLFRAKDNIRKMFPDKNEFTQDELVEFAAFSKFADNTLINKQTGNVANAAERFIYRMTESSKFTSKTPRQQAYTKLDQFFKYRKMESSGQKLTKSQRAAYEQAQAMLEVAKKKVKVENGVVYVQGSHKSVAKGLGGVNDQFVVKANGDIVHFMNDKNDLMGQKVPGDADVVSLVVPSGYNVFNQANKKVKSKGADVKAEFQNTLASRGAPKVSKTRQGLLTQAASDINQTKINMKPRDFIPAVGVGSGIVGAGTIGDKRNER